LRVVVVRTTRGSRGLSRRRSRGAAVVVLRKGRDWVSLEGGKRVRGEGKSSHSSEGRDGRRGGRGGKGRGRLSDDRLGRRRGVFAFFPSRVFIISLFSKLSSFE